MAPGEIDPQGIEDGFQQRQDAGFLGSDRAKAAGEQEVGEAHLDGPEEGQRGECGGGWERERQRAGGRDDSARWIEIGAVAVGGDDSAR